MEKRQIPAQPETLDLSTSSAALGRLIEEVGIGAGAVARGYNRTYNRHNR